VIPPDGTIPLRVGIRDVVRADHPAILAINNAAVPAMNRLDDATLDWLVRHAAYARVATDAGSVSAFLLGLPPGTAYESANYRWFEAHFQNFLYVDRVAVIARARGRGIGTALYSDIARAARPRYECLLAEVNEVPPNPRSITFHEQNGFVRVGELAHAYAGAHATRVSMWRRALE
jgi:hypothetical protein